VRYAVVGLGYISQAAVLPAFAHAGRNSELAALVSDDPVKLRTLGKKYGVERRYAYEEYDACLASGIDAVYIALPNHLHREYSVRAAQAGIHVLCEKPMAVTVEECEDMIRAADANDVRLMVAYRLHFDPGNLAAVQLASSGRLGDLRMFTSSFSMQVKAGDIRLQKKTGGGTLYDIGVYCINAARYLFEDEPLEVFAFGANNGEERFREVDEMTGAVLKFPGERIATFITSFGAADLAEYRLVGTRGTLQVENAYEYAEPMRHVLQIGGRTRRRSFARHDQFAPELLHFSDCVQKRQPPEPSGLEGLIDVEIVRALYRSAEIGKPVPYDGPSRRRRPEPAQAMRRPPLARKPELVHAESPSES
jgi:glucose-fructose oxidoreductase